MVSLEFNLSARCKVPGRKVSYILHRERTLPPSFIYIWNICFIVDFTLKSSAVKCGYRMQGNIFQFSAYIA